MEGKEISTVTSNVLNSFERAELGLVKLVLSEATTEQLLLSLVEVAGILTVSAFDTISKIYTQAIISQEKLEGEVLATEAAQLKAFNTLVEKAMEQVDLSKPGTVEQFEKACQSLRINLETYYKNRHKPNLFRKLFRRK